MVIEMRKGQKLSKATTRSQQLQVRKNMREYEKREKQRIRRDTRRRASTKYNYSQNDIDGLFVEIVELIYNLIKKVFHKIFR